MPPDDRDKRGKHRLNGKHFCNMPLFHPENIVNSHLFFTPFTDKAVCNKNIVYEKTPTTITPNDMIVVI